MYSGVARSSYRQHSCDDVTKMGLCDWFTNELTDWRRRRRKEKTYGRIGRTSGPPIPTIMIMPWHARGKYDVDCLISIHIL